MTTLEAYDAHTIERRAMIVECKDILYRLTPMDTEVKRDCLMALDRCREAVDAPWPDHSVRISALGFLEGYYVGVRSHNGRQGDSLYALLGLAAKAIALARLPEPGEREDDANPDLTQARSWIAQASAMAKAGRDQPPLPEAVYDACGHAM